MGTPAVTIDPKTIQPFPSVVPPPAEATSDTVPSDNGAAALRGAIFYASQHDPVKYAKLLKFQKILGIPPVVSSGNEEEVQQQATMGSIDAHTFSANSPRTAAWASNPDNAAVSGVKGIQVLGGIENNVRQMDQVSAYNPSILDTLKDTVRNGPLGRAIQSTMPGVSAALGIAPTQSEAEDQRTAGQSDEVVNLRPLAENALLPDVPILRNIARSSSTQTSPLLQRFATGIAGAASGLTTPVNAAFMAGTGGLGLLPDATAAAGTRLLSGAFSGQMLYGLYQQSSQFRDALHAGDSGKAAEIAGQMLSSGVMAGLAGKEALTGHFHANLSEAVDAVNSPEAAALKERAPDQFGQAVAAAAGDGPSLRIPVEQFNKHFSSQKMDPQAVAEGLGATNYVEAHMSGGDVEVPKASFLADLTQEHQEALIPHVADPASGLTPTQQDETKQQLSDWASNGGAEKLVADFAAANAETASTPEYTQVKEDLHQRYVAAGETPEVADTLATKDANVYTNLAREAGMKPSELMNLYNPKVVAGEAPEGNRQVGLDSSPPAEPISFTPPTEDDKSVAGHEGKATTLLTPARELAAKYRMVEADSLVPSHDAQTFAKSAAYPEGLQERAYDTSKEAQNRVIQQGQNYDPRYTVNTNPDAVNGPPVITPDGTVLGGNSRAMSTQRHYADGGTAYKDALKEQAATYGFTPEQVDGMNKPVLVRQVEQPATPDDARRLGSELNKSMTGAMGVSERAVSAGKNLKPDTLRSVANMMQEDNSTLREAMAKHGSGIVKMLTSDGVITDRERPQFVDAATGGLSEEGKTFVERALMGSVIDDPRLMDSAPKAVLSKLERSLGSITSFAFRSDEWNLLPVIRDAVSELGAIQRSGNSVEAHLGQIDMFGAERNPLVDTMVRSLDGKPNAVRDAFESFARDADQNLPGQSRMFVEANAFDAFNEAFGSNLTEQEYHDGLETAAGKTPNATATQDAKDDEGVSGGSSGNAALGGTGGGEAGKLGSDVLHQSKLASSEFMKWFGESKVVDEKGQPLVVYHGTNADFDTFSKDKTGSNQESGKRGFFLTTNPEEATRYADGEGGNVKPSYVAMQNPLIDEGALKGKTIQQWENMKSTRMAKAIKGGHDGIIISDGEHKLVVPFDPEQIKSAIGNRGTFDPNDPSILHQGGEQPRGWFRALPDGSFEIGKTKIGDLSTFVHEPAHAYLHMLRDLASREGSSETLKGDYSKVLNYLGAKEGEPLTVEQHEKWAEANEQYLREGKAPSPGLRGVFMRFSVWLGSVYHKASDLGVQLSPEIRDVFDRMYAAEDGVNKAAMEAGPQLFKTPEEAGWTPEQFKKYADDNNMTVAQAKSDIIGRLNESAVRDRSDAWREEEKNVRQGVTDFVDSQREYKAIRSLRKGELEDGTPLTMNKDALVQQFGEDRVKALQEQHPGLYRTEGGTDAETAAEIHGFSSGEEMMQKLGATPRRTAAIDTATRDLMTAKHGDIRYDGTLDDQSRLALHNDNYAKARHAELTALKQKVADLEAQKEGQQKAMRSIEVAPIASYRDAARQMVQEGNIANLQPTRYLDATRKYSSEAFDAARKGDAEAAETAKHKELLNHYLYREAIAEKEYVTKQFEPSMKRYQGKTVQSNLGLAGSDYRGQANKLLARYEIGFVPGTELPTRTLAEWASAQYDMGKEPAINEAIYNEKRTASYRTIPLSELHQVHDALKNIKTLAYQEMHIVVNGRRISVAEAKNALIERARASLKVHPESIFEEDRSLGERSLDLVNRGTAPMIRTEFLMKRLDGGVEGPWHDNLWHPAADAQGVERELQEGVTKVIGDMLKDMPDDQKMRMQEKVTLPGWGELTRKRLISMALNLGNDGNIDRLRKTFEFFGKDPKAVDRIPQVLSREDLQLIQGLWDSLKPMGVRMNAMEREATGLPPVMVTPTPLHVDLADGTHVDLAGGYYPIVMDARYSERAQQQDVNATARNLMESGYGRASTSRGYTKERTGFAGPLLLDHEQVLTQHIAKASKDISHRSFILLANRLLQDTGVQKALRETVGKGYEKQMMPWLRTIVNDRNGSTVQGLGDLSEWMGKLRTNVVEASLGFKLSTLLLQVTHASSIMLHTSAGSYAQAMVDFMAHPSEMTEQIRNLSPNEMKNRGENIDRDMRSVLQEGIQGPSIGKVVARAGMYPVKLMDHILSFPLWLSVHREAMAEHAELPEDKAKYLAMQRADGAVRMGLGSNAPKDLPAVMRKNDFWKMVTALGGFENLKLNQVADASYSLGRDHSVGKFTYRMLMAAMIPAVVGQMVSGHGPKDDENAGTWAAKRALLFPVETIPLLGNVVRAIDEHNDAKFTPIVNVVDKAVTAGVQAGSSKEDKDWTGIGLNAGEATGQALGIPGTIQAARIARYAHRASEGEISDPNAWDAVVGGAPHK